MTLNRIALRLAIISSLTNFGKSPYPTAAGPLIFDSKIEPSEQLEMDDKFQKPIAVIYTDYDKDFVLFRNKLQKPRLVTVTIELLMVQASEEIQDEDGAPTGIYELESPVTDSELEMSLDLFERQVFETITADSSAGAFFNTYAMAFENVISRRGAAVTGGQRLAARQTTVEIDLARDPRPGVLPDATRRFLEEVRDTPESDFRDRAVKLIRAYEDHRGLDAFDFQRKAMGLTGHVAEEVLGMPPKPRLKLPLAPKIHWVGHEGV